MYQGLKKRAIVAVVHMKGNKEPKLAPTADSISRDFRHPALRVVRL